MNKRPHVRALSEAKFAQMAADEFPGSSNERLRSRKLFHMGFPVQGSGFKVFNPEPGTLNFIH
jgi:hypothetical protein